MVGVSVGRFVAVRVIAGGISKREEEATGTVQAASRINAKNENPILWMNFAMGWLGFAPVFRSEGLRGHFMETSDKEPVCILG